jgi:predicted lipid-binding transport protein (Tim44 family)
MGQDFQYLDIILLAMVAGFVALRLRSVLGRRTGDEEERAHKRTAPAPDAAQRDGKTAAPDAAAFDVGPAEKPAWTGNIDRNSDLGKTLSRVMVADRNFNPDSFVEGARAAYGMIVEAYAAGDRDTLKTLLAPELLAHFEDSIKERESKGQTMTTNIVDIEKSEIAKASLENEVAEIAVRFQVLCATAVRDAEGHVVSGNVSDADHITDLWTFSRNVRSADPNWLLVDTDREE